MKHRTVWSKTRVKAMGTGRKMTEEQIQKKIRKLITDSQFALGLDRWVIEVNFAKLAAKDEEHVTLAECEASWEYKDAHLTFNTSLITENRLGAVVKYIVRHEMSHCISAPLADLCEKMMDMHLTTIMEMETSHIERLPLWDDREEV